MQIVEMKVGELAPYERNPRKNDDAVEYVANSIKEFGFKVPIVIDKNKTIVAGHTRWKAAKRLRLKTVPCVIADDLTDEQIKAFRLADNKVGEFSGWDFSLLTTELDDMDIDMTQFGFMDIEEADVSGLFEAAYDTQGGNTEHEITCPHCGEKITLDKDFEPIKKG